MNPKIAVTSIASISSLGPTSDSVWNNYLSEKHCFIDFEFKTQNAFIAKLDEQSEKAIFELKRSEHKYKSLDNSVLFAIYVARQAMKNAGWNKNDEFGINIGSSRGATELFENFHKEFLETSRVSTLASPTTTLGNISSWVAHDLQCNGPEISHSITCSTALHAVLNGVAWLKSGMTQKFMVGGSEAPLTDFTIAQMKALKIYAKQSQDYPCRALDIEKSQNTMILGEGAAVCCLEIGEKENALAYIEGIGYATELLEHNISISAEADCFQKSMKMALKETKLSDVDVIVMHAPGTKSGDKTELAAIKNVFGEDIPLLTTNKWKIGHTFGASGMLSIEMAIMMMQQNQFISIPYVASQKSIQNINKVLVNAVGFGGNAVSILLSKR